jgi:hypothetical protein
METIDLLIAGRDVPAAGALDNRTGESAALSVLIAVF